jgi:lipopolysaccharide transport system ATP-binding protein
MYRIGTKEEQPRSVGQTMRSLVASPFAYLNRMRRPPTEDESLWALRDVSFEVKHGEVLGIIGRNGSGKSTLLKILSRITEPTAGRAAVHGRVASLLEVGTGFHPELTGRENIYLNGAIMGMQRTEIDRKFDEIVAFAEIERFLDTPVKRYSSGMYVRLAFAVAAHLESEILLVDEVLAVGDAEFQRKCIGKIGEVAHEGRTVLFVSHNMASISALCTSVYLVDKGSIAANGNPQEVIGQYIFRNQPKGGQFDLTHSAREKKGDTRITTLRVLDSNNSPTGSVSMGGSMAFEVAWESKAPMSSAGLQIGIYGPLMEKIALLNSSLSNFQVATNGDPKVAGTIRCILPYVSLTAGQYYINLAITDPLAGQDYDHVTQGGSFEVIAADVFGTGKVPPSSTPCFFSCRWENIK